MPSDRARFIRRAASAAVATLAAALSTNPLHAITRRDEILDSNYLSLAADPRYAAVGAVIVNTNQLQASGTLIAPGWVLTAAHVVDDSLKSGTRAFNYGTGSVDTGTTVMDSLHFFNSGWNTGTNATASLSDKLKSGTDIGLMKLSSMVTSAIPTSRFFPADQLGLIGTSVGYGQSGVGSTGQVAGSYGTKRAAQNVIDVYGNHFAGYDGRMFMYDFDDIGTFSVHGNLGDSTPLDLEGMIAGGDSGGGVFVQPIFEPRSYIAGIHSFFAPAVDGVADASYSDVAGSTRVSVYNSWIDDNIVHYYATSSGTFGNSGSWTLAAGGANIHAVPSDGDIAGLAAGGLTYSMTFGAGATVNNHQLLDRGGNVTFNLNGGTYNLTSTMYEGAMVVGRYNGEIASTTFTNGTINSHDVIIGQQPGAFGTLTVGSGTTWNITADPGGGSLAVTGDVYVGGTFGGVGGNATLILASSTSTLNMSGTLKVWNGGIVRGDAGRLSAGSVDIDTSGRMNVGSASSASLTVSNTLKIRSGGTLSYNLGTLSVGTLDVSGGAVMLSGGGNKVLRANIASVTLGGQVDLADNDMIVDSSSLNLVKSYIQTSYAGGLWNAVGITSSNARALQSQVHKTALGYAQAGSLNLSSFDGLGVGPSSILVKYTYSGDANLDGLVDIRDLRAFAVGYNSTGNWIRGDFNYDGLVNSADLGLMAANWQLGVGSPLGPALDSSLLESMTPSLESPQAASVPEPTACAFAAVLTLPLLSLRRRRR